eukprot:360049-Chlamydomonas_euryale.AAC.7
MQLLNSGIVSPSYRSRRTRLTDDNGRARMSAGTTASAPAVDVQHGFNSVGVPRTVGVLHEGNIFSASLTFPEGACPNEPQSSLPVGVFGTYAEAARAYDLAVLGLSSAPCATNLPAIHYVASDVMATVSRLHHLHPHIIGPERVAQAGQRAVVNGARLDTVLMMDVNGQQYQPVPASGNMHPHTPVASMLMPHAGQQRISAACPGWPMHTMPQFGPVPHVHIEAGAAHAAGPRASNAPRNVPLPGLAHVGNCPPLPPRLRPPSTPSAPRKLSHIRETPKWILAVLCRPADDGHLFEHLLAKASKQVSVWLSWPSGLMR